MSTCKCNVDISSNIIPSKFRLAMPNYYCRWIAQNKKLVRMDLTKPYFKAPITHESLLQKR